jgi:lycopene cyclase domain-containing protein|tara:strand:- start:2403 stop:2705 length:303 start_codon:yes stop_codon:yes gene_type:complete
MEYLLIEIVIFVFFFALHRYFKLKLFQNTKQTILFFAFLFVLGIVWDSLAVFRGHWVFPGSGLVGITIFLLPIEDYLFMILVPYLVLVSKGVIEKFSNKA